MNDKPIDELVAEKVMGWIKPPETSILKSMWVETPIGAVHPQLPKFSTNVEDAWLVVEKLEYDVKVTKNSVLTPKYQAHVFVPGDVKMVFAETAPMAICIAALKAVGEEWQ
ncbi:MULTISPECIES: BC1872 family protein [Bacillus cereus group]|uniref:BC1872 family protein n=1 Tax=Bacillus cereus group TaxID=86661 RepID=UPI0018CDB676|nr:MULTISPECIES: hypothetical protein [Bacillus cereus group]MBG9837923.1 hypothetical protein [Bacillus tropicus]MBG9880154.1 hypothetical protein [Bacillus tropicus]MBG9923402.1 hypothetical protein [Bacillus tropicus]MBJ8355324.1 hypothetical protein [Bacillus mycoides]MED2903908.1 hypothetical protein [Bacillus tropicus]